MDKIQQAYDTIDYVRGFTKDAVLFNSLGKDSLVTLDLIAPRFQRVVCVFMYFVPNLDHINRFIGQVQHRYPNIEMLQVPHWNLSYIKKAGLYCDPDPKQRQLKLRDVIDAVKKQTGIPFAFTGMKKADSMNRRLMLNGYETAHYTNNGIAYPLATWNQREVLAYMRQRRLPEPVRYGKNASNGVGFNLDCFLWMEKNAPQDLDRMYEAFPQSRRILFEYHYNEQHEQ